MSVKVSINILLYNGQKYLPEVLAAVKNQTYQDLEVLIIDNASSDDGAAWVVKNYPQFRLERQEKNLGFCAGHNLGIKLSTGEYVLCLNQDIILEPDFVARLVEFMDAHPRVGAATGRLNRWDFERQQKTQEIDSLGLRIFKNGRVEDWGQWEGTIIPTAPVEIFGVSGAAPLYRRAALEDIKFQDQYFDEDFFAYKEDVDLACRLRWRGWQAYLVPPAVGYHDRSVAQKAGLFKNRRQKSQFANYHSYRNHLFYLLKNLPKRQLFPVLVYELGKLGYILFFEPQTLRATLDFITKYAKMLTKREWIQKHRQTDLADWSRWFK